MSRNIVFTGMRGSGKSHFGSEFAKKNWYRFVDTDQEIEKRAGKKIAEIVAQNGWGTFRKMEYDVCKELSSVENTIISVGGGTVMQKENVELLKKNSIFVFLYAPPKELFRRLEKSKHKRPPLRKGLSLREEIQVIWQERRATFFETADFVFCFLFFSSDPRENVSKNVGVLQRLVDSIFHKNMVKYR
ncbi:shikimate kinase [Candidatus Peregrinibacteria bacterium]|nr:shikimate kinase [Candidatus Peregrinibacteria bacterium]